MKNERTGRIQITGLTPEDALLIKDAAHYSRKTIREYVVDHARVDMAEAQAALDAAQNRER